MSSLPQRVSHLHGFATIPVTDGGNPNRRLVVMFLVVASFVISILIYSSSVHEYQHQHGKQPGFVRIPDQFSEDTATGTKGPTAAAEAGTLPQKPVVVQPRPPLVKEKPPPQEDAAPVQKQEPTVSPPPPPPPPPQQQQQKEEERAEGAVFTAAQIVQSVGYGEGRCDRQYGLQVLREWADGLEYYCGDEQSASNLQCSSRVLPFLPVPTRPHTIRTGRNILMNYDRLSNRISCLRHRPGYKCEENDFHRYDTGAWQAACQPTSNFQLDKFCRDHLRDIFDGFEGGLPDSKLDDDAATLIEDPVLFVVRENGEYANLFHAHSDFINAFAILYLFNLSATDTRVVFLDEHKEGPYDVLWQRGFSRTHAPMHVSALQLQSPVRFSSVYFVPPGYTNLLLSENPDVNCDTELDLLAAFRQFVYVHMQVPEWVDGSPATMQLAPHLEYGKPIGGSGEESSIYVTLIVRRPYNKFVEHSFMGRQIVNERELLEAVQAGCSGCVVRMVDLTHLTYPQQLSLIAKTHLLVGMHGAALAYSLFLPPNAALLELLPTAASNFWSCHQYIAGWRALGRDRWENTDAAAFWKDRNGDYLRVQVEAVARKVAEMVEQVRR